MNAKTAQKQAIENVNQAIRELQLWLEVQATIDNPDYSNVGDVNTVFGMVSQALDFVNGEN